MAGVLTRLMQMRRTAFRQEALWAGLFAAAVVGAVLLEADPVLAVAVGVAAYLLSHLLQASLLLRYLLIGAEAQPQHVWGVWREAHDRIRWMNRRERKRKRRQRRVLSNFRDMAAAMPDGVITFGSDGRISWLNRQAEAYFGLAAGEAAGRNLIDLVEQPALREFLRDKDFSRAFEVEAQGDPTRMLSVSVSRFKKRQERYLLVARDITSQYHLNQTQRDFTLNVSHELRTPLTVLHGYIEALLDGTQDSPQIERPLRRMAEQTLRMQHVIQDMSVLSCLEGGQETAQHVPVAVYALLEEILADARELVADNSHELRLSGDRELHVVGDRSLLRSAFSNLVYNAIHHTPARSRVEISWHSEDGQAVLSVRDNGAGIARRHLPRLTERFYRVDASRSRDVGGTGLGLAIVRQILELHGARLQISSEEGRGATFSCHFAR